VEPIADWVRRQAAEDTALAVALVGHLPFLDPLVSLVVAGDEAAGVFEA
jgi:phosphohistidine phosphatase SixA